MSVPTFNRKDQACVNTLRLLAADMIEAAKSGHPGLPLGAAPMAYVLLSRFLKHNPKDPQWPGRDRFILSAGHGSALLYAWLYLAGYGLSLDDLKNFRQWQSLTPGHPEYRHTPGVEATTGPLGHGFAMGVGLAMGERALGARFNRPGFELFDYNIYAIVSDGDLMEGVSAEAASLAGTHNLGRLIYLYDDNQVTIEGHTDIAFTEDVRARFLAYGWQVIVVSDGNDLASIYQAIENAKGETEKPSLIMVKTKIGAGSPKEDSSSAHGEPLGAEALAATKKFYGYDENENFFVDERVSKHFTNLCQEAAQGYDEWLKLFTEYQKAFPEEGCELARRLRGELPDLSAALPSFEKGGKIATRASSGTVLNALAPVLPELLGGSADLAPSNKTFLNGLGSFSSLNAASRNIHFGIREHAMGAITNGLALTDGLLPFAGTFLVFSDFVRPAIRLAALMKIRSIFVFTHDSVGVGEDGPTHQPIEHLIALRSIPGLCVLRPADAYETAASWLVAIKRSGPTCLILSRQNLPTLHPDDFPGVLAGTGKGAYILAEAPNGQPEALIMATGSEVQWALGAQKILAAQGKQVRVVSMPSWELFEEQDQAYRESVLPPSIKNRLAVEAGRSFGWHKYVGDQGQILAIDHFGCSAPADKIFKELNFTAEHIAEMVNSKI